MTIVFTGSRQGLSKEQLLAVKHQVEVLAPVEVHHGDCVGADEEFDTICRELGCVVHQHPSTLDRHRAWCPSGSSTIVHPPQKPLKRNQCMVNACDLVIAAPSTSEEILRSGTWATIRYARKLDKRILLIWPDGSIEDSHQGIDGQANDLKKLEELTKRKLHMINRAYQHALDIADDDEMKTKMKKASCVVYESCEGHELGEEYVDGMEDMLGDDILETDFDIMYEDPPHLLLVDESEDDDSSDTEMD